MVIRNNFGKGLSKFGRVTANEIKNDIIRKNVIDTGALLRSINFFQVGNYLEFSMLDYGKFTDEGTIYIRPREYFIKTINNMADKFLEDALLADVELTIERVFQESGKLK
jgi:hypothetical protein